MADTALIVDLAEVAGRFGDLLHAAGVPVSPGTSGRFAAALAAVRPGRVDELYWCARVTMLSEQAQIETFDRVFDRVFRGAVDVPGVTRNPDVPPIRRRPSPAAPRPTTAIGVFRAVGVPAAGPPRSTPSDDDDVPSTAAASAEERLRTTPFDACTPAELEQLRALMDDLALDPPQRRSRRHRRAVRGEAIDLRQSLRAARHTGGDPLRLVRRRRRTRQRRVVLIADVSGSMEAYGRAYLYLLHGAVRALRAEAFVFATRLHRLTRQLRTHPAGRRPGRGDGRDPGLVGRHPSRRRHQGVQRRVGPPRAGPWCRRGHRVRRLGRRRSSRCWVGRWNGWPASPIASCGSTPACRARSSGR